MERSVAAISASCDSALAANFVSWKQSGRISAGCRTADLGKWRASKSLQVARAGEEKKEMVLESLAALIHGAVGSRSSAVDALRRGHWVKLICGASFEDVAEVRNLSLVYALAGVDCIDCAADPAVLSAVLEGVSAARDLAYTCSGLHLPKPWIMVSINDDEDPHFRKAEFDPKQCPSDCPRPCERVCPVSAITFSKPREGVITERCYGCGRCLPICPLGLIRANTYVRSMEATVDLLSRREVDAIEIHTGAGHLEAFGNLWKGLEGALQSLKLIAVSVPDLGESMIPALGAMYDIMKPTLKSFNLWQLDGRPMSGDIGAGATRAAVALAAHVVSNSNRPAGFLQLAGGTNGHTLQALRDAGLIMNDESSKEAAIGGVAYGGYARKIIQRYLSEMEARIYNGQLCHQPSGHVSSPAQIPQPCLEEHPWLLLEAVKEAASLVQPSKLLLGCERPGPDL